MKPSVAREAKLPNSRIVPNENSSIIYWCCMLFLGLFLFITPFFAGLFNGDEVNFEKPIYSALIWSAIIIFLLSLYFFYNWTFTDKKDLAALLIWLIPLTYLISHFNAASKHLSMNLVLLNVMYASFFILGLYFIQRKLGATLLQYFILVSGYVIVFFGFFTFFGNLYYQDSVILEQGIRLTSVFQYANAYAALLIALLFAGIYTIIRSNSWYSITLHGIMLVPVLLSILLTLSRGGIVVMPFIILLILPFLTLSRQLLFILHMGVAGILSLLISSKVTALGLEIANIVLPTVATTGKASTISVFSSQSITGWGLLLLMSLLSGGASFLIQRFVAPWLERSLTRFTKYKYAQVMMPAAMVLLGSLGIYLLLGSSTFIKLLPETMQVRIESINFNTHSVLERNTFYRDAVKIIKESPIIGSGGGGWLSLYQQFQNNPYSSKQAHNFFLQYLIEVGIFGFIVFVTLVLWVFYTYIVKYYKSTTEQKDLHFIFYIIALTLLVHSAIDFEMSYVYFDCLFYLCLGAMFSGIHFEPFVSRASESINKARWGYPVALTILGIFLLFISLSKLTANSSYNAALFYAQNQKPLNEVFVPLDSAINKEPGHPIYNDTKIDFLLQGFDQTKDINYVNQAKELIVNTRKSEPNNRMLLEKEYRLYVSQGDNENALRMLEEGIKKFPWEISFYERAAGLHADLWLMNFSSGQSADKQHLDRVQELYVTVVDKTAYLDSLPKEQLRGRPFSVTPNLRLSLAKVAFANKDFKKTSETLHPAISEDFSNENQSISQLNRNIARFYIASLNLLGNKDEALYNKLIAADANEVNSIEQLLSSVR
ncbi:O-antigen ligase family protein [Paenibacillus swuensis]|uniref:O-antigen ligase family protein n=1 Tax=Paenibacillus swuensis TaxID=1178515 RepID=UPI0008389FD7|nr:O-antigen ligase family protein [Paenibacillus swuensis]